MNEQARRALERLKEEKDRANTEAELRPAIEQAAAKDYNALAVRLKAAIATANADESMKDANVELVVEGPWSYDYTDFYLLRLRGGKPYPNGTAFLVGLVNTTQFDHIKVRIAVWQSHLTIRGLQENLSGYVPGEQPRRLREYSYSLVQAGSNYAWSKDQRNNIDKLTTDELINDIIGEVIVENLSDSR